MRKDYLEQLAGFRSSTTHRRASTFPTWHLHLLAQRKGERERERDRHNGIEETAAVGVVVALSSILLPLCLLLVVGSWLRGWKREIVFLPFFSCSSILFLFLSPPSDSHLSLRLINFLADLSLRFQHGKQQQLPTIFQLE